MLLCHAVHADAHTARLRHAEVVVRTGHRVAAAHHHGVLVAPAGPAHGAVDRCAHFGIGLLSRDAGGGADGLRQVGAAAFEHLRQPIDDLAAEVRRGAAPAMERAARGFHRIAQVLAAGVRDVRHQLVLRVMQRQRAAALRARVRALHEELPGLEDGESFCFGHGCVPLLRHSARYAASPCMPPSRPKPLSLKPPKGLVASNWL